MTEINKIYIEDCLITMKAMPENFIDMVLTSPPYDNLRDYKGFSFEFESIAKELYRVLKTGGVIIWVIGDETIDGSESATSFKQALKFMETGFNLHDTMIYYKNNPMPTTGKRYHQHFEYMYCFSKGQPKTFNPIMEETKYNGLANMKNRGREGTLEYKKVERTKNKKIGNVFFYSIGGGISTKDKVAYNHPAIFPEKLAHDQIQTWSNKGDLIYDPFLGSGTTAKIAKLLERNWIGSEISEEYAKIASERLEPYINDLFVHDEPKKKYMSKNLVAIGSQTAKEGFKNEDDIVRRFNMWKEDAESGKWLEIMGYDLKEIEYVKAVKISGHKTDVQVQVTIKLRKAIDVQNLQVKLVSQKRGYNQIDKRWTDKYAELWNIPKSIIKTLKLYTGESKPVIKNPIDKRRMYMNEFSEKAKNELVNWLNTNKVLIVNDILKGRGQFAAEWMLVAVKIIRNAKWALKPMNEVINYYGGGDVNISNKGVIHIGKITIQRKGGDGGRKTAQMLQFKIDPTEVFNIS